MEPQSASFKAPPGPTLSFGVPTQEKTSTDEPVPSRSGDKASAPFKLPSRRLLDADVGTDDHGASPCRTSTRLDTFSLPTRRGHSFIAQDSQSTEVPSSHASVGFAPPPKRFKLSLDEISAPSSLIANSAASPSSPNRKASSSDVDVLTVSEAVKSSTRSKSDQSEAQYDVDASICNDEQRDSPPCFRSRENRPPVALGSAPLLAAHHGTPVSSENTRPPQFQQSARTISFTLGSANSVAKSVVPPLPSAGSLASVPPFLLSPAKRTSSENFNFINSPAKTTAPRMLFSMQQPVKAPEPAGLPPLVSENEKPPGQPLTNGGVTARAAPNGESVSMNDQIAKSPTKSKGIALFPLSPKSQAYPMKSSTLAGQHQRSDQQAFSGSCNRNVRTVRVITDPRHAEELETTFLNKAQEFSKRLEEMNESLADASEKLKEQAVQLYALNNEALFLNSPALSDRIATLRAVLQDLRLDLGCTSAFCHEKEE